MGLSEMSKFERAQFVAQATCLLEMSMNTPEGIDMHFHWSPHVDWIVVSIFRDALYVDKEHKDYNAEREKKHYRRCIEIKYSANPVAEVEKTINECQQVLDKLKQEQEVA